MPNGSINASATGGTPPYTFSRDGVNFQANGIFTGLQAIAYTITVKDATGLRSSTTIQLPFTYPPPDFNWSFTDVSSCSGNDGFFDVHGLSGPPPYTFSFDNINYSPNGHFGQLAAGDYTLFMRDGNGCVLSYPVPVINNCYFNFNSQVINPDCSNANGSISISALDGTPPFQYSINGGSFQGNGTFSNLSAAVYTIQIKDANGILNTQGFSLFYNCPFSVSAVASDADCNNNGGSIAASVTGGVGPFQYSIDGMSYSPNASFTGLGAGNYVVSAKDPNGSIQRTIVTVNTCAVVTAVATDETCGNKNGTIIATVSGGTPSYLYSLDGVTFQNENSFKGLSAGNYTVTIKDAHGSVKTTSLVINSSPGVSLSTTFSNPTCQNGDGSILAVGNSLVPPILFSLNGASFQSGGTFSGLGQGIYEITAKDGNGCFSKQSITLQVSNNLSIMAGVGSVICQGTSANLTVKGNASSYSWTPGFDLDNPGLQNPTARPDSTTKFYVTGTFGVCESVDSVTITVNKAPIANAGPDSAICFGKNVQLQGTGGVFFKWRPATYLTSADISDPIVVKPDHSISYSLTVTDANGCNSLNNDAVRIIVTPPGALFVGNDTAIVQNQPLQLNAEDVNNSGFTNYDWTPTDGLSNANIRDPIARLTTDITYKVTAKTSNGCEGSATIHIAVFSKADIYVPNAFTPNGDGHNDIFRAKPVGIKEFKFFAVFNRWGQEIFYTSNPDKGWDGKVNGVIQSPGTFIWLSVGTDFQGKIVHRSGSALLLR